jgi:hypothetical protein
MKYSGAYPAIHSRALKPCKTRGEYKMNENEKKEQKVYRPDQKEDCSNKMTEQERRRCEEEAMKEGEHKESKEIKTKPVENK